MLLLSDEPQWNARLLHPKRAHVREYWAQVERIPSAQSLRQLETGVTLGVHRTLPCRALLLDPQPEVAPRNPPIRVRKTVPDCWISLELVEGKYHQVRKMTASVGHPTLRLIRVRIGRLRLADIPGVTCGTWIELNESGRSAVLSD
jgi:23S rRNA pseudouridine2457 synthase